MTWKQTRAEDLSWETFVGTEDSGGSNPVCLARLQNYFAFSLKSNTTMKVPSCFAHLGSKKMKVYQAVVALGRQRLVDSPRAQSP